MAFSLGSQAIEKLRVWPAMTGTEKEMPVASIKAPTLQWLIEEMAPAKVLLLLAVVGVYLSITLRNRASSTTVKD